MPFYRRHGPLDRSWAMHTYCSSTRTTNTHLLRAILSFASCPLIASPRCSLDLNAHSSTPKPPRIASSLNPRLLATVGSIHRSSVKTPLSEFDLDHLSQKRLRRPHLSFSLLSRWDPYIWQTPSERLKKTPRTAVAVGCSRTSCLQGLLHQCLDKPEANTLFRRSTSAKALAVASVRGRVGELLGVRRRAPFMYVYVCAPSTHGSGE